MIGERIRETRLARRRSLADVAAEAEISGATLSRIETNKQSLDLELFLQLARVLGVQPQDLLGEAVESGDGRVERLVRRISGLAPKERLALWRQLAQQRAKRGGRKHRANWRHVVSHVEELLAQIEFLRQELESVRNEIRRT